MQRTTLIALAISGTGSAAALRLEMDDHGVVRISDDALLAKAVISMHGQNWRLARNENGVRDARRSAGEVKGRIPLPASSVGTLDFTVQQERSRLTYEAAFTDRNDIYGCYVSFMVPAQRFAGRQARLLPSGKSKVLPTAKGAVGLSGTDCGIALDIGNDRSLVIAGDTRGQVLVQDNRKYGASEFEVRFHLFGRGLVLPGMTVRRSFRIAALPHGQVEEVAKSMEPEITFDPEKPYALLQSAGQVDVRHGHDRLVSILLGVHGLGWAYTSQGLAATQASGNMKARALKGTLEVGASGGKVMEFAETATVESDGALGLAYWLHFPEATRLNGYQVSFNAHLDSYAGATITLATPDGERLLTIPPDLTENFLFSGPVSQIRVAPESPRGFVIDVNEPSSLLIQDNRGWGGSTIELRFNFRRQEEGEAVPAGETVQRQFTFRLNDPMQIVLDEAGATTETDKTDWVPFTLPWDSAPVDVSFLNHKPAGEFGFVMSKDGKFVFADTGEEVRFWGTCFSAGANFPSHEQSEKIARRLAKFGINMVRTHHADAPWAERHFFKKSADHTRELDRENLDRFDYLVYCLKREGIYLYLDQLVHRRFKTGDGVDAVAELGPAAKPYSNFDPKLIALQKEFSKNLWAHVNPYTKLAYRDDPAIALMELANENDLFTQGVTLEPYRTRLEERYRSWASDRGVDISEGKVDFGTKTNGIMEFLVHVQRAYYAEMERYLREDVGVRVPMTGSNWSRNAALLVALQGMAFTDSHAYHCHPGKDGSFGNVPMLRSSRTIMDTLGFQRVAGKPFFVSEWDEPWPNEWRAELATWIAAVAGLQGWNGLTVYTYRHTCRVPCDRLSGAFETFNDPTRIGLFPQAALLFRRGDMAAAKQRVAVHIPLDRAIAAVSPTPYSGSAYGGLSEVHRFETVIGEKPLGFDRVIGIDGSAELPPDVRVSDTGQLWRSIQQRIARIDTPRTQVVFGFLGTAGPQSTANLTVDCQSKFATLALSSLTDSDITTSERLLLTAVGRAENTGFKYNILRNKRLADGRGPILIDPIRAIISVRTDQPDLTVHAIAADGQSSRALPATYDAGRLTFSIGPEAKTIYYEMHR